MKLEVEAYLARRCRRLGVDVILDILPDLPHGLAFYSEPLDGNEKLILVVLYYNSYIVVNYIVNI